MEKVDKQFIKLYKTYLSKGRSRNELPKSWYQFNLGAYRPNMLTYLMKMTLSELKAIWLFELNNNKTELKVAISKQIRLIKNYG